jgi:hypothetical protein
VPRVSALADEPVATSQSAAYSAGTSDFAARITGLKQDAIVALAGLAANRREIPALRVESLFEEGDDDITNARAGIYRMLCLEDGFWAPDGQAPVNDAMMERMTRAYMKLVGKTDALVDEHWTAILRVAKHLERHSHILNRAWTT